MLRKKRKFERLQYNDNGENLIYRGRSQGTTETEQLLMDEKVLQATQKQFLVVVIVPPFQTGC